MAYRRRRVGYRRRRRGGTPWYRRKYNAMQLASAAWRGVRYVKGLVNSEKYHYDTAFSSASIPSAGNITHLTSLAQGDTSVTRTGNSVLLKDCYVRLFMAINPAVVTQTRVRMILFFDKQQVSDTSPSVTDVLAAASTESMLNLNASGRFKIVYSREFVLSAYNNGSLVLNKFFKFSTHVRFNGTAGSDIQRNGLYVLFIGSEATNTPTVSGTFRIGYHDN